jgi:diguanylate cyclase (GGDEF)-like protein
VDIIITDYMLPRMNGIEFLKAIQAIAPDAQCMILTGHSDLETTVAAINEGAIDFFLSKPVRADDLYHAVEKLWRNRKLQLERDRLAAENRGMIEELMRFNAKLEETVNERTLELTRANEMLRQALREIEAKNQTLTELNQSLNVLATEDPLTGLFNRREFHHRLGNEWERFRRYNRPFSLIMIDIDHFKKINDTHGHDCGDIVLAKLGELLRFQKRRQDIVCRYGGEEFVIVLAETKLAAAVKVAEKLRSQIEQARFKCGANEIPVRISLGVAGVDVHQPRTEADLVRIADTGLYLAKHSGRNRTVVADPANPDKALELESA